MDDEKLILEVQKNEILYDKTNRMFKDKTRKQDIWIEIGEKLHCSGEVAQKRWRNIRDAFHLYNKKSAASKSGDAAKTLKKYKFADILGFIIPHLKHRETASNVPDMDDSDQMACEGEIECSSVWEEFEQAKHIEPSIPSTPGPAPPTPATSSSKKRMKTNTSSLEVDKTIIDYLNRSQTKEEDDIDHFFRSVAHSVRKLSSIKRAEVKFKIHQIVHDAEIEHLSSN